MTKELNKIYTAFPKKPDCIVFLEKVIWEVQPQCPYCKTSFFSRMKEPKRYHCNKCNTSFSVTVGTMFHRTRCDLQKWFLAILLIGLNNKKITSRELATILDVTKDTAWLMINKVTVDKQKTQIVYNQLIKYLSK